MTAVSNVFLETRAEIDGCVPRADENGVELGVAGDRSDALLRESVQRESMGAQSSV